MCVRAVQRIERLLNYLMVGIGGFVGAVARLWIGEYVGNKFGTRFPLGTLVINCTGCFAIGVIVTLLDHRSHWNPNWRYLVPIGFIGAYTTFSTFGLETLRSMQSGRVAEALLNVGLSVIVGVLCVWMGMVATNAALNPRRVSQSTSSGYILVSNNEETTMSEVASD